ncbi:hypothetical protein [uncultured Tenacibaculum sp.]|uniref:hypothetical protein n=1 Tax=uncultured Tenacibaculum sp. TaxID=174713 RepID=UPI002623D31F|nr:hypothetical protein [uncultured Tenacibaculum sp.]
MKTTLLRENIENKSVVWFSDTNQYIVLENKVAEIIFNLNEGISIEEISKELEQELEVSFDDAIDFTEKIYSNVYLPNIKNNEDLSKINREYKIPTFLISKFYKINNLVFKVDFLSEFEEYLVHPKFSHLEIEHQTDNDYHFQVFTEDNITHLLIDDNHIGSWHRKDIHYFQGKFSMYIVQYIHNKPEDEWMGIFHASGLGNKNKSLLLLGDSGNGKSTSLAILQANGLTCLADDFVPIDINKQNVYTFPSAISIKKNSLETLLPMYPELETSAEFHFKRLNKIVRFLPPKTNTSDYNLPCNDLVFIKYEKNSDLDFNSISKLEAFEQLVPDSWISSKPENVKVFLKWFSNTKCYRLTYSDNEKMVKTIKNLLNDDI